MTNPTAGYSYNICVNDNDFGGACMKRLRFTADMTKEQKRNTVAKQWFRTSANTAFRATYPSPQAPTYATVSCTMCFTCAQRNSEHPRRLHPRTVRMRAGSRKSKHHGKHAAGNDCKISGILHRGSRNQQRRSKRSNGNYPLKQTFRPSYRNFGAAVCFFCYFLFCKPYFL